MFATKPFRSLLVLLGLASVSCATVAPEDVRIALVIGNSAYAEPNELPNAARDARAVVSVLEKLNFRTKLLIDADQERMTKALQEARSELVGTRGVGLFFFAGHGIQDKWVNYLLPVDAGGEDAAELIRSAVPVPEVLRSFSSAETRLNVLVLDACRDNPFGRHLPTRGLADIDAPPGTLIAFSTAPGNVASDGTKAAANSPYARALIDQLQNPRQGLVEAFRRVRLEVRERTSGRQVPGISSNLAEDFRLDTGFVASTAITYEAKLARFESEKVDWDLIKGSDRSSDLYDFLRKHPDGFMTEVAQFRLDQLQKSAILPSRLAQGKTALPSGSWRYLQGDEIEWDIFEEGTFKRKQLNRVTSATALLVEVNGGEVLWDQMGGILRNRFGVKNPAVQFSPAEVRVGKRWRSAVRNMDAKGRQSTDLWESHAVRSETITVPAGTFEAIRVERKGESRLDKGGALTVMNNTIWIDPETMQWVRNDLLHRYKDKTVVNESWRLARWQRATRP